MGNKTGIYPGTFDPVTNGHMDIINRASNVVDNLIIGVAVNDGKGPLFTLDERVKMIEGEIAQSTEIGDCNLEVKSFEGLLTEFATSSGASLIIRGLRAVSDFEYEFQLASMNRHLTQDVETAFLTPTDKYTFISSTLVREVATLGGDITEFVSSKVKDALLKKVGRA